MQKQIDEIVTESQEFKAEINIKGKENLLNDRFLSKGDINVYQYEQEGYGSDFKNSDLIEPRMMSVK